MVTETAATSSDTQIQHDVLEELKWDARLQPNEIGVAVKAGIVTLRSAPMPDDLKQRIEQALVRSAQLDAQRISVELQGSKVILKGTVRSWAELKEAERVAYSAPGVTAVDNRIKIAI